MFFDGACFRSVNSDGDLLAISRNKIDRKFHVLGDLAVTPYSLLSNVMSEMERIITTCGKSKIYIMAVLPRYVLNSCCDSELHCTNVRNTNDRSRSEILWLLDELAELNSKMARRLAKGSVTWLSAADILSGSDSCTSSTLLDSLYSCWSNDPVHGDKMAYSKLAMCFLTASSDKQPVSSGSNLADRYSKRPRVEYPLDTWESAQPQYVRGRYGYYRERPPGDGRAHREWRQNSGDAADRPSYSRGGGGRFGRREYSRR